jgi:hypothetical protein
VGVHVWVFLSVIDFGVVVSVYLGRALVRQRVSRRVVCVEGRSM